jgi:biotin carboxyl carrier protein
MKMEIEISAPRAGKLTAILVAKGDHIEENQSVASLA